MPRDEDLDLLEQLADRMKLDDKQADSFINQGMQKLGYKPRMDWDDPDPDGNEEPTDMFGGGGNQRRQRRVGNDRNRDQGRGGRRASGSDWSGYDG